MSPERSWMDRLLPGWLGGSSDPTLEGGRGGDGDGPEHRRILSRMAQLREGLERAAAALPEEDRSLGRDAGRAADALAARARAASGEGEDEPPGEVLVALREGGRALHDAHFSAVRIRVAADEGREAGADEAREELEAATEAMETAASSLEELAASGG